MRGNNGDRPMTKSVSLTSSRAFWLVFAGIVALFGLLPLGVGEYKIHVLILCLVFVIVSVSWNLLALTRQVSLGHSAFFGLGAYTSALLSAHYSTFYMVDILAGGVVAMTGAILIGMICLRMAPWALAVSTLSFAEALKVACSMLEFTSGQEGVSVLPLFGGGLHGKLFSYYLVLGIALAAVLTTYFVMRSRFQFAFQAIHDEEQAASMLGVNPVLFKVLAFALSAFFTGMAGAFYAHYTTFIEPASVFNIDISVEAQLMPLIGGLYTFVGPIIGAIAMTLLTEYLRVSIGQGFMIVYGGILVVTILFLPDGLIGLSRKVRRRFVKAPVVEGA